MKKLTATLALAALGALIGLTATARAGAKVDLCHFPGDRLVGFWLSVSEKAVDAHLTLHGDLPAGVAEDLGGGLCTVPDLIVR